tara:strand:+ start:442 stop:645 length:204 start_codon:yes stop_codon:yes gene_type:complete
MLLKNIFENAMSGIRTRDVFLTSQPVAIRLEVNIFPMIFFVKPEAHCSHTTEVSAKYNYPLAAKNFM